MRRSACACTVRARLASASALRWTPLPDAQDRKSDVSSSPRSREVSLGGDGGCVLGEFVAVFVEAVVMAVGERLGLALWRAARRELHARLRVQPRRTKRRRQRKRRTQVS